MKKIIRFVGIIAVFALFGITANASAYKDTLRIGLSYGTTAAQTASFVSSSDINVYDGVTNAYIATIPPHAILDVSSVNGSLSSNYFSSGSCIKIESATNIMYNNKEYKGAFELRGSFNNLTVINIINTEDYVASVLGKEMSASWPLEALKAQAVCARNYALTIGNKHANSGFDLCSTIDCQVYGGVSSEAQTTRQAAEQTRGVTVTYNGKVVPLYYFSCDGGNTESSENVWVSKEGYLRGKKDIYENPEYATRYNWTKTYTKNEIEEILLSKDINIGELLDITVDEINENQSVMKLTFVGSMGSKTITKSQARTTLSLNSQSYTVQKNSNSFNVESAKKETYFVLTRDGMVLVEEPVNYLTDSGMQQFEYTPVVTKPYAYDSYTFTGHGWGHRIGMSQWGAYSMAKLGFTYKDILNFYFTDIIISEN